MTDSIYVLISGTRYWSEPEQAKQATWNALDLAKTIWDRTFVLVHGGAVGVDSFAEEWAKVNRIETEVYIPDYSKYGNRAPIIRNQQMLDLPLAYVIVIWNGVSKGTSFVIDKAKKKNLPMFQVVLTS
jgi:hypothetical protein